MFDDLNDLYQQVILDHSRSPRNFKKLDGANRIARGHNPLCGDRITIYLHLDGDVCPILGSERPPCKAQHAQPDPPVSLHLPFIAATVPVITLAVEPRPWPCSRLGAPVAEQGVRRQGRPVPLERRFGILRRRPVRGPVGVWLA